MMSSNSSYTESVGSIDTHTEKLSTLRHKKKRAEDEARLLANRISLLEKEEQRAIKKVMVAKSRAEVILEIREEADRKLWEQVEVRRKEKKEEEILKQQHSDTERATRENRAKYVQGILSKKKEDVSIARKEGMNRWRVISQSKHEAVTKNKIRRDEVLQEEEVLREARIRVHEDMLDRNRRNYDLRVMREVKQVEDQQSAVRELEAKEKILIDKLRGAQTLQQNALSELESALNGTTLSSPTSSRGKSRIRRRDT